MITHSGKTIFPRASSSHTGEVPSINDIARGLARQSRFAGQTRDFYTVLCHSLVVGHLLEASEWRLYGLLHDCSEAIMGDVPTTWKPAQFKALELEIQEDVCRELGLEWPWPEDALREVAQVDFACLAAEAHVLGHAAADRYWPYENFTPLMKNAFELTRAYRDLNSSIEMLKDPDVAVTTYRHHLREAGLDV